MDSFRHVLRPQTGSPHHAPIGKVLELHPVAVGGPGPRSIGVARLDPHGLLVEPHYPHEPRRTGIGDVGVLPYLAHGGCLSLRPTVHGVRPVVRIASARRISAIAPWWCPSLREAPARDRAPRNRWFSATRSVVRNNSSHVPSSWRSMPAMTAGSLSSAMSRSTISRDTRTSSYSAILALHPLLSS